MPRHTAFHILRSGSTTPLRCVDPFAQRANLDDRDRRLLRRLIGTEVRRRGSLRALVDKYTRAKPKPDVATHLRLGFAQLYFMDRVPPHAAVSETVRATADTVGLSRGKYVNATLRAALRDRRAGASGDPRKDIVERPWHQEQAIFRDPETHPLLWAEDALSVPAALLKRWQGRFGDEQALALARQALTEPQLSLLVTRGTREAAQEELAAAGVDARPGAHERVLLTEPGEGYAVLRSPPFVEGRLTVQGETALRAAELVQAEAGERVLDLAAAPGGKAVAIALTGASVVAADVNPTRLARLPAALERIAPEGTVHPVVCDGARGLGRERFDAVLLDAPCSNTGVLAARPGARWRFGPASQRELTALQERLLNAAGEHVRPGGRLVYSTCSLESEEGEQLVRRLLASGKQWSLEQEHNSLPSTSGPGPVDGGYAARLRKHDS